MLSLTTAVCLLFAPMTRGAEPPQSSIEIRAAFVRILEKAEVPASDKGTIQSINVKLGQAVNEKDELARLEDSESGMAVELARLDVQIAKRNAENGLPVKVAQSAVREAELDQQRAMLSRQVVEKQAADDSAVQQAARTQSNKQNSLGRLVGRDGNYRSSVSQAEIEERQLELELSKFELIKARIARDVLKLRAKMEQAAVDQFGASVQRLTQAVDVEKENQAVAKVTQRVKEQTLAMAEVKHQKRRVLAPISGEIVEILRHKGEWVEPGTPIVRVVRLDRLRVEGYVPASQGTRKLLGSTVSIESASKVLNGVVTYVSPEVDSVNGQVQVHVEFDNKALLVRPGEGVKAFIKSNSGAARTSRR